MDKSDKMFIMLMAAFVLHGSAWIILSHNLEIANNRDIAIKETYLKQQASPTNNTENIIVAERICTEFYYNDTQMWTINRPSKLTYVNSCINMLLP